MTTFGDEAERKRALTELSSTLLVEAAAGTGKTSLLAGRVVLLLASGIAARNIAAITFTELAAGELRFRVGRFVNQLLSGEVPKDLQVALPNGLDIVQSETLKQASLRLDEITSATIHGFCHALLSSYAVEADVDPGAQVLDATQADFAFRNVFDHWLRRRLGANSAPNDPIALMARWNPEEAVEILRDLGKFRRRFRAARPVTSTLAVGADRDLTESVRSFRRWFDSVGGPPAAEQDLIALETLANFYDDAFSPMPTLDRLWQLAHPPTVPIMRRYSYDLLSYRRRSTWGKGEGAKRGAEAADLYEQCAQAYRVLLGQLATHLVAVFSLESDELLDSYEEFKRSAALLDFDDLLVRTKDLVSDHDEVREAVANRFTHILVDEFQDTDPVQSEILFLIAGVPGECPSWHQRRLLPGRLFLVGDPKQAIYRFRGADLACYMQVRAAIERDFPGNLVRVTSNFRSRPDILTHVNFCFEQRLRDQAPGYVALEPTRDAADHGLPCVAKLAVQVTEGAQANDIRDEEAKVVADVCARLVGNLQIRRPNGTKSLLEPGDIALLAPAGTQLWRYERALEERQLPFVSQAGKSLFRRQETQDFVAIARVLADSRDTLALGALLRGPMAGLSEEDLLDIVAELPAEQESTKIPRLTLNTDPALIRHPIARDVITTLQDLRRKVRDTTPLLLLSEALERLRVRPVVELRSIDQSSRALANLDLLLERARAYAIGGLGRFARDLHEDWSRSRSSDEARVDAHGQAIEIITVHSAKGLEWPVVIPINMGTGFRSPDRFIYRRADNSLHWMLGKIVPPALGDAIGLDQKESAEEGERLLYVACTRAMELLAIPQLSSAGSHSWAKLLDLKQGELPELPIQRLKPKVQQAVSISANEQTQEIFAREASSVAAASIPIRWVRPSESDPDKLASEAEGFESFDQVVVDVPMVQGGAMRGNILHKLMEEILTGELGDRESEIAARARDLLSQLFESPETLQFDPDELAVTVLRTLALPEISERRQQLLPELPAHSSPAPGVLLSGRADAVAVDRGVAEIVFDWKSDTAPTKADRRAHRTQLRSYVGALGAKRGAVVYMTLGQVEWVEKLALASES